MINPGDLLKISVENSEPWYETKWMLILWGSLFSLLSTLSLTFLKSWIDRQKLKRAVSFDIFTEVVLNGGNSRKLLKGVGEIKDSFSNACSNNFSSGHPSLNYNGVEVVNDFFKAHKKDLSIFDEMTLISSHTYYLQLIPFVDACAKKMDQQFKGYYANDPLVGLNDVTNSLEEYMKNISQLIKASDELSVRMMFFNRKLLKKTPNGGVKIFKKNKKTIKEIIKKLRVGEEIDVYDIMQSTQIHYSTIYIVLFKDKTMSSQMFGKFKKISENRSKNNLNKLFLGLIVLGVILLTVRGIIRFVDNYYSQKQNNLIIYQEGGNTGDDPAIEVANDEFVKDPVDLDKICECEKEFKEEYPIEWSGYVMSIFLSGEAIGVKRFDQSGKYKQFMVRTNGLYDGGGDKVRIKGSMVGMTCAYYNTIFGECVPDVVATAIEIIK